MAVCKSVAKSIKPSGRRGRMANPTWQLEAISKTRIGGNIALIVHSFCQMLHFISQFPCIDDILLSNNQFIHFQFHHFLNVRLVPGRDTCQVKALRNGFLHSRRLRYIILLVLREERERLRSFWLWSLCEPEDWVYRVHIQLWFFKQHQNSFPFLDFVLSYFWILLYDKNSAEKKEYIDCVDRDWNKYDSPARKISATMYALFTITIFP